MGQAHSQGWMQWIPSWISFFLLLLSGPGHDAKKGEKESNLDDPDKDTDDVPDRSKGPYRSKYCNH